MSTLTWEQVKDIDVGSWKDPNFASERLLVSVDVHSAARMAVEVQARLLRCSTAMRAL